MGLWSRKCHRFLIAGPFNFQLSAVSFQQVLSILGKPLQMSSCARASRFCSPESRDPYLLQNGRANGQHYFGTTNLPTFLTTLSGACASISTMPSR